MAKPGDEPTSATARRGDGTKDTSPKRNAKYFDMLMYFVEFCLELFSNILELLVVIPKSSVCLQLSGDSEAVLAETWKNHETSSARLSDQIN